MHGPTSSRMKGLFVGCRVVPPRPLFFMASDRTASKARSSVPMHAPGLVAFNRGTPDPDPRVLGRRTLILQGEGRAHSALAQVRPRDVPCPSAGMNAAPWGWSSSGSAMATSYTTGRWWSHCPRGDRSPGLPTWSFALMDS